MNEQEILRVDPFGRIKLSKNLCTRIGLINDEKPLHVGILRSSIAIGIEMPPDCIYSYPAKINELGQINLNVYVKSALGIYKDDNLIIERINNGNYAIAKRHIQSILNIVVPSHCDEFGRLHIPAPMLSELSDEPVDGLYVQTNSEDGHDFITIAVTGEEKYYRPFNNDVNLVSMETELKEANILFPCLVYLQTFIDHIAVTKA